ncbi:hypothetical protein [Rhizobium sp.]|uniref:hypothetical protein n=1 Tax=Rhizobium sp. TaxID=391 RepID=UPI0028AAB9B6
MITTIYFAIEFHGRGDQMSGGTASDWALYQTGDGHHAFMSAADGQGRDLVRSYFASQDKAAAVGAAYRKRGGCVGAIPVAANERIDTGQIRWLVGNLHVGLSDEELSAELMLRGTNIPDRDMLAQMIAYGLAFHHANQALVRAFAL